MVNVILVTYGIMALGTLSVAERIAGMQSSIQAVSFTSGEDQEGLTVKVQSELEHATGGEFLILTDIRGGIPWTVCRRLAKVYPFALAAGMNVPMVVEAIFLMEEASSAADLAEKVCEAGRTAVMVLEKRKQVGEEHETI